MEIKKNLKALGGVGLSLFLALCVGCSTDVINFSGVSHGNTPIKLSPEGKTIYEVSGKVEFPEGKNTLSTKATLTDVGTKATVSLIYPPDHLDPAFRNVTIATGLTNENGTFAFSPDSKFTPILGQVYVLEAIKRIGGQGNSGIAVRTNIKWNGSWQSITTSAILINDKTTAVTAIAGLNPAALSSSETIGKLPINNGTVQIVDINQSVPASLITQVQGLVNDALVNNLDPIFSIVFEGGIYKKRSEAISNSTICGGVGDTLSCGAPLISSLSTSATESNELVVIKGIGFDATILANNKVNFTFGPQTLAGTVTEASGNLLILKFPDVAGQTQNLSGTIQVIVNNKPSANHFPFTLKAPNSSTCLSTTSFNTQSFKIKAETQEVNCEAILRDGAFNKLSRETGRQYANEQEMAQDVMNSMCSSSARSSISNAKTEQEQYEISNQGQSKSMSVKASYAGIGAAVSGSVSTQRSLNVGTNNSRETSDIQNMQNNYCDNSSNKLKSNSNISSNDMEKLTQSTASSEILNAYNTCVAKKLEYMNAALPGLKFSPLTINGPYLQFNAKFIPLQDNSTKSYIRNFTVTGAQIISKDLTPCTPITIVERTFLFKRNSSDEVNIILNTDAGSKAINLPKIDYEIPMTIEEACSTNCPGTEKEIPLSGKIMYIEENVGNIQAKVLYPGDSGSVGISSIGALHPDIFGSYGYGSVSKLSLSPDGFRVIASGYYGGVGNLRLMIYDYDGYGVNYIQGNFPSVGTLDPAGGFTAGAWSPNGKRIVFSGGRANGSDPDKIFLSDPDGRNASLIKSEALAELIHPSWSPDGSKIVFVKDGQSGSTSKHGIYLINALNGQDIQMLTGTSFESKWPLRFPRWSPDGKKILFSASDNGSKQIFLCNLISNNSGGYNQLGVSSCKILTSSVGDNSEAVWAPDGSKIAFTSTRDSGKKQIYMMNADGTQQTRLTNLSTNNGTPTWSK